MSNVIFYNTLSRQKEEFKPLNPKEVTLYTCGPTVYESPSIGNWRTYVFEDVLKRTLEYAGFPVKHIMNITDVGHLTSDEDTGADKLQETANKQKITAWDVAKKYEEEFISGLEKLNIEKPTKFTRATDYIQTQVNFITELENKNFTYQTSDGIYFDTSKLSDYGKLAKLDIQGLKEGYRVEINPEKKNPTDFALWKFSPKDEKRDMEWECPWGTGFPGWHIECSAMILKELGKQIDIHCGGIDLIPTHHTNEIAQSEALNGQIPAKFWLHGEFLQIDGGRMGKSLGNAYTLDDVVKKGLDPLDLRFYYFSAHYRSKLNFTWEALQSSSKYLNHIRSSSQLLKKMHLQKLPNKNQITGRANEILTIFEKSIFDDLNMPKALAALNTIVDAKVINLENRETIKIGDRLEGDQGERIELGQKIAVIREMDKILGLDLLIGRDDPVDRLKNKIPEHIQKMLEERNTARNEKNWVRADELRVNIEKDGFKIIDSKSDSSLTLD